MKPKVLALMETASFCGGVWHKRYSEQQEKAPNAKTKNYKTKKSCSGANRAAFHN
jgi:hypothetical protein